MTRSDLIIMAKMASLNMGIRMSPHLVSANLVKAGGHVTMGVDAQVVHDLLQPGYLLGLYVLRSEDYDRVKKDEILPDAPRMRAALHFSGDGEQHPDVWGIWHDNGNLIASGLGEWMARRLAFCYNEILGIGTDYLPQSTSDDDGLPF